MQTDNETYLAFDNPQVENVFLNYPETVRESMLRLRQLIFATARDSAEIDHLEETLKWGEPSYLAKGGSTVRIDWKEAKPRHYAVYFNCKTRLIETIRELYRDRFDYEGNRALLLSLDDEMPEQVLKQCFELALTYHRRKHLPMLDI